MLSGRDESEALKRLTQTATTSASDTNEPAYALYRALSDAERHSLLGAVIIAPKAPNIANVGEDIRAEARLAVRREQLDSFVIRLEGWWFTRVLRQLIDDTTAPILSIELEAELNDLREQFQRDALPVDQDIFESEIDTPAYEDAVFVHQVRLTEVGGARILTAIRDYYRAFAQRSRWMREELLLVGELDTYERLLREEWELQFARVADELGEDAAEEAKRAAAQRVYAWVEDSRYPIRPQVQHPSVTRGSFHILANTLKVGWHPEFMLRLEYLLESKEAP
jgi:hypothetical protein